MPIFVVFGLTQPGIELASLFQYQTLYPLHHWSLLHLGHEGGKNKVFEFDYSQ